jgi:exopolysaccharide production protein ExoQ
VALFLQTGALFPLLLEGPGGGLDDAARAKLRLLFLPTYAITAALLARHPRQFLAAVRRNLPLVALLGLPVLSVVWSLTPSVSARRTIGLLGAILLAYLLAVRFTPRQIMALVAIVLGACMVLSLALMVGAPHMTVASNGDFRGAFFNKNVLGWSATLSMLVCGLMAADRSQAHRRIALGLFVASLICLVASGSATGLVAATAALVLTGFYQLLTRSHGLGRVVFVLLFIQFVAALLLSLQRFLPPLLDALGKDATLTGRVPLWQLVDDAISHRLLIGYGYQAFWTDGSGGAWGIWLQLGWMAPHAHNGFRDTLLSLGLVGFVTLALVMVRALRNGAVLQCRAPDEGWLWLNVWIGTFLVMNLTESILLAQNDVFWTLCVTAIIAFSLRCPETAE